MMLYTWDGSLYILRSCRLNFSFNIDFLSLKIVLASENSVDSDQMQLQVKTFSLKLTMFL